MTDAVTESLLVAEGSDWFHAVWYSLSDDMRQPIRDKARWEHMSLRAVLIDWPTLVPRSLQHLIPKPVRSDD